MITAMESLTQANQLYPVIQDIAKINISRELLNPDNTLDLLLQLSYSAHFNNKILLSTSTKFPGSAQLVDQVELLFNQIQSLNKCY